MFGVFKMFVGCWKSAGFEGFVDYIIEFDDKGVSEFV